MHVAVVGAEGYVGRALCRHLQGYYGDSLVLTRIDSLLYDQEAHYSTVRVSSAEDIIDVLKSAHPDVVVWLAAYAHDPQCRVPREIMVHNNANIPGSVGLWCAAHNIVFIAASSLSVWAYEGAYPDSKRHMEWKLQQSLNFCRYVDIIRFGTLFGSYGDGDVDVFRSHLLLNSMVFDALSKDRIEISFPSVRRPVLPLGEAVRSILELIKYNGPRGRIENLAMTSGTLMQFAETVRSVIAVGGPKPDVTVTGDWRDKRDYGWGTYDPRPLERLLPSLIGYTRKNLEDIAKHRAAFPENYYAKLKV